MPVGFLNRGAPVERHHGDSNFETAQQGVAVERVYSVVAQWIVAWKNLFGSKTESTLVRRWRYRRRVKTDPLSKSASLSLIATRLYLGNQLVLEIIGIGRFRIRSDELVHDMGVFSDQDAPSARADCLENRRRR